MAPLFVRNRTALDILAEDLRDAPRDPDPHPARDDTRRRSPHQKQLRFEGRQASRECQVPAADSEDLQQHRNRRPGVEASSDPQDVSVAYEGGSLRQAYPLVAMRSVLLT